MIARTYVRLKDVRAALKKLEKYPSAYGAIGDAFLTTAHKTCDAYEATGRWSWKEMFGEDPPENVDYTHDAPELDFIALVLMDLDLLPTK